MAARDKRLTRAIIGNSSDLLRYFQRRVALDDAPDLLGETMVAAWRRVASLPDDDEQARMWLFGIARGTLLNYSRGERRRWALVDRLRSAASARPMVAGPDEGADVRDAIDRLAPESSELVRLVHWDRLTIAQAAEVLNIPASTARSRYATAKEKLRTTLSVEAEIPGSRAGGSARP